VALPVEVAPLVQARLAQAGFAPGRVDGVFDADAVQSLRDFQSSRGLPVTGVLDADTMTALMPP
jgi:peptidoglycan hydrolase-like protein with peptidoglycan-binding domain